MVIILFKVKFYNLAFIKANVKHAIIPVLYQRLAILNDQKREEYPELTYLGLWQERQWIPRASAGA